MSSSPYLCPNCGLFHVKHPPGRLKGFVACHNCGTRSNTMVSFRKPGDDGAPAIQGDVPTSYYSPNLNQIVGSKNDIREAQKHLERTEGYVPMGRYDLKGAAENAANRELQARRDRKWFEREGHKIAGVMQGSEPTGEVIAG